MALCSVFVASGAAQELEPRAYSPSPAGVVFFGAALARSFGPIVADRILLVDDIEVHRELATVGAGYTFGLFGNLALATALLPYASSMVTADLQGTPLSASRSGLADARFRMTVHFRGNPAMGAAAFARAPRRTIIGGSVAVAAPTGQYERTRLINLGSHSWALKPEAGVSVPRGKWDFDASGGVWFFTTNRRFFPGRATRTRDPLLTFQGRAVYTVRPQFWLALHGAWSAGGKSRIDGRPGLRVRGAVAGVTLSLPVRSRQSIRISYTQGAAIRAGPDFKTVGIAWQKYWLTEP